MVSCSLEHEWTICVSAKVEGTLDAQAVSNGLIVKRCGPVKLLFVDIMCDG